MRRLRLPLAATLATLTVLAAGPALAQEPSPQEPDPAASLGVTAPNPQPKADNECYERDDLRCPDLRMGTPQQVYVQRTPAGRTLLRSRNRLQNRGDGPLALHSERDADESTMRVRQRIYRDGARGHISQSTHARLDFWRIPGQGGYWKVRNPVEFQVWTMGERREVVAEGEKSRFCMRDLFRRTGEGPQRAVFPACAQDRGDRSNRQGISVGWDESYPGGYFEQYVDVSDLRNGCYKLWHTADPNDRFDESDETNNASGVIVGLRDGRVRVGRCF
ncbi:MAG: lysyl oxidase family protein [Solirubrobacteraceae bacterium MAG38_C4-C5]|nr:lysyl oxidase family protein [Candidatus Siliceabacter maunaloa]